MVPVKLYLVLLMIASIISFSILVMCNALWGMVHAPAKYIAPAPLSHEERQGKFDLQTPCLPSVQVRNPFVFSYLEGLYDVVHTNMLDDVRTELVHRWYPAAQHVQNLSLNCKAMIRFGRLLQDGLAFHRFGVDLSAVQTKRYGITTPTGAEMARDHDVDILFDMYFRMSTRKFFRDIDMPGWFRQEPLLSEQLFSQRQQELLNSFNRDGFVLIDRYDGLDSSQLDPSDTIGARSLLDQLLQEGSLLRNLVHGYLRATHVSYNGAQYMKLKAGRNKSNYDNSLWHHDGCGQRLKAFIYLTDVDDNSHHTLIAAGTQRMLWYPATHYFEGHVVGLNKLNETAVHAEYGPAITKMLGKVGGGFIFDTNALHSAEMAGLYKDRVVFVLDFASSEHMLYMPKTKGYVPGMWPDGLCPSSNHHERVEWRLPLS